MNRLLLTTPLLWFAIWVSMFHSPKALADLTDNSLQVQNPTRSIGYFVGDILEQKINLDAGNLLAPELPTEERISAFLYRISATVNTENKQRWLSIRYQIINAPAERTTTVALPGVTFKTTSDTEIVLDPWSFNIATLVTGVTEGQLVPQADQAGIQLVQKRDNKALIASLIALALTILTWIVWWIVRHFRDSRTLPFAKAHSLIKRQPATERDSNSDSWVAMHHAFNSVAGKTISSDSIDKLYTAAPWLVSQKELIERFYNASAGRFFKQSNTADQVPVEMLSRSLYHLEKKQAKKKAQQQRQSQTKRNKA